jgi:hypothetical protein
MGLFLVWQVSVIHEALGLGFNYLVVRLGEKQFEVKVQKLQSVNPLF